MKKLVAVIAVAGLIGTPAFAADMAVKAPPPPPAPVYNWTGWYAGINFGGGWGTSNNATTTVTPLVDDFAQFFPGSSPSGSTAGANSGVAALNQSGLIGGGQFGYNWQFAPLWVLGFEADIQGAAITSDRAENTGTATERFAGTSFFRKTSVGANSVEALLAAFTNPALSASGFDSISADVNWLGTARARLGYLVTPNLLLYATGGLAYGGVSASASDTLNFNNFSADAFALAFGQATGPSPTVTLAITTAPTLTASAAATTTNTATAASVTPNIAAAASSCTAFPCTLSAAANVTPPTSAALATASAPGQSTLSFAQITKPLSVALNTTAQSVARVSETRVGGTIGGGVEWMMAPNWSVKAEALYYDLGSVTVSAPLTASINPIALAIGQSPITGANGAINKFVGPATVSNAAVTHVNFQGVIIRIGLNYHFNWGG